jgi:membrane associated rhomboid family serine protease
VTIEVETDPKTSDYAPVAYFEEVGAANDHALVILAMNLDCLITIENGGYQLYANGAFATAIHEEFRLYAEEQKFKPEPLHVPVFSSGLEIALVWVAAVFFCFISQQEDAGVTETYLNSSQGVVEGLELYRPFTALFLHGDFEHLLGNVVFGVIFFLLVSNSFGPLRGWVLVMLSGFLGNTLNVVIHHPDVFRSLGASTAVFGALGLLVGTGLDVAWRERSYRRGLQAFVPLLAGLMLFSIHGIGGPGTDVTAHLLGLFFGIALGFPASRYERAISAWGVRMREGLRRLIRGTDPRVSL